MCSLVLVQEISSILLDLVPYNCTFNLLFLSKHNNLTKKRFFTRAYQSFYPGSRDELFKWESGLARHHSVWLDLSKKGPACLLI